MFVANNVMSFNEIWRKSVYNCKQRVTKSNNIIVNHVYHFTRATTQSFFYTTMSECMIFVWTYRASA